MAIISEIKCARCDRKYSGVRSRCPYCGARRIGRGKYTEDGDNARGKMLISVLIMAVFTVAAGVLLFTTPAEADDQTPPDEPPGLELPNDDAIDSMEGIHPVPPPPEEEEEPEPEPAPPLKVTSFTITYEGNKKTEFMAKIGEVVPLRVKVEPVGVEFDEVYWESSDTSVFEVVSVDVNGSGANVTGIGKGSGVLTVTVGDVEETCTVYVQ